MNYGTHKDILLSDKASEPLTSQDQSKLLIFTLLMLPTIPLMLSGVIPTILLTFGIYMMKKSQDFSHVEVAVKNFKRYTYLIVLIGLFVFFNYLIDYLKKDGWYRSTENIWIGFWTVVLAISYSFIVDYLFLKPLKAHSDWVRINGIFSSKIKDDDKNIQSELNIIKGEKLKQFSVADELLKWAKLKEDGHITEAEFNEARAKLLNRNN